MGWQRRADSKEPRLSCHLRSEKLPNTQNEARTLHNGGTANTKVPEWAGRLSPPGQLSRPEQSGGDHTGEIRRHSKKPGQAAPFLSVAQEATGEFEA